METGFFGGMARRRLLGSSPDSLTLREPQGEREDAL
jgi:hypothetical protein